MDFGFALKALKDGKSVSRIDWPSSRSDWTEDGNQRLRTDEYIYLIRGNDISEGLTCTHGDDESTFTSTICLKTKNNTLILGWVPSQKDMLSTDWFVLEDK